MRNTNWTIIALALLAAAAVFYFMKQSDFMKTKEVATAATEMATSMDVAEEAEEMEDLDPYGIGEEDNESMMVLSEEEVD